MEQELNLRPGKNMSILFLIDFMEEFCLVVCCKALVLPNYLVYCFKPGEGPL